MVAFASLALLLSAAAPAARPPGAVNPIESQCAAATNLDGDHKQHFRVYADVSDVVRPGPNDGHGKWREFKKDDELKAYLAKNRAPHTQAFTWSAPDGTTIAVVHFAGDSADWSDEVEYCFRPDGSLARAAAALANLEAEVYGHRTTWFAADGTVLFTKEKASENGRRRKPGPDLMEGLDPTIVYPTVKSLPFNTPAAPAPAPPLSKAPAPSKSVAAAPSDKPTPALPPPPKKPPAH
jgi:hypothetical protein